VSSKMKSGSSPVMGAAVDLDEDVFAGDRFEIVEHAIGQAQRAEMPGRALARAKCRYRDGLDVAVIALESRNRHAGRLRAAKPLEGQHAPSVPLQRRLQVALDQIAVGDECFDAGFDLAAMVGWQIIQPVRARIAMGNQIDEKIDRRHQPGSEAVAGEVALDELIRDLPVPADINRAAHDEEQDWDRSKIGYRGNNDREQRGAAHPL